MLWILFSPLGKSSCHIIDSSPTYFRFLHLKSPAPSDHGHPDSWSFSRSLTQYDRQRSPLCFHCVVKIQGACWHKLALGVPELASVLIFCLKARFSTHTLFVWIMVNSYSRWLDVGSQNNILTLLCFHCSGLSESPRVDEEVYPDRASTECPPWLRFGTDSRTSPGPGPSEGQLHTYVYR